MNSTCSVCGKNAKTKQLCSKHYVPLKPRPYLPKIKHPPRKPQPPGYYGRPKGTFGPYKTMEEKLKTKTLRKSYNKARKAEYRAMCRALPWSKKYRKQIREIYSRCPPGHHVDHVYPLFGKDVCGLHVPWNLEIIPATANMKKSNVVPMFNTETIAKTDSIPFVSDAA